MQLVCYATSQFTIPGGGTSAQAIASALFSQKRDGLVKNWSSDRNQRLEKPRPFLSAQSEHKLARNGGKLVPSLKHGRRSFQNITPLLSAATSGESKDILYN